MYEIRRCDDMASQSINFKIDGKLKEQFTKLAEDLGITCTNMLTMFIKKAVDEQGIPFEVKVTNKTNPIYERLFAEEQAKIQNLIPDDATTIADNDLEEYRGLYK
jgi:addiction module RelB/DinJ family antitoxin